MKKQEQAGIKHFYCLAETLATPNKPSQVVPDTAINTLYQVGLRLAPRNNMGLYDFQTPKNRTITTIPICVNATYIAHNFFHQSVKTLRTRTTTPYNICNNFTSPPRISNPNRQF
jgi:hypothetical protein